MHGRIPTRGPGWQQNNQTEHRQRVDTYVDGNTIAYEGTITSGTVVCDFNSDSNGRICHRGYFINDGPGDIQLSFSFDGSTYGGVHTIKIGEQVDLNDLSIKKLKLTYVSDANYRILMA